MTQDSKHQLRQKMLVLLKSQQQQSRFEKSRRIAEYLYRQPVFICAKRIMFYSAFGGEVETTLMMIQAQTLGKKVVLPMIIKEEKNMIPAEVDNLKNLTDGPYGIAQPGAEMSRAVSPQAIDVVLVPGVAFDLKGNRLGRGQGYYDRFLKTLPLTTPTIGLAFDFQVVEDLPVVPGQDVPVSSVIAR